MKIHGQLKNLIVGIDSLKEDESNVMIHSARNMEAIKNSLEKYGQRKPIVVNKKTRIIMAGNGTWKAAKELNAKEIAAIFIEEDNLNSKAYSIMDNKSAKLAEYDYNNLKNAVAEIDVGESMIDELIGFTDIELTEMFDYEKVFEDEKIIPEMELQAYEHYDYIMLVFVNTMDWVNALDYFQLEKVNYSFVSTKKKIGLGRVVNGAKYMARTRNENSCPDKGQKPVNDNT